MSPATILPDLPTYEYPKETVEKCKSDAHGR
jgi:hypothetical protein